MTTLTLASRSCATDSTSSSSGFICLRAIRPLGLCRFQCRLRRLTRLSGEVEGLMVGESADEGSFTEAMVKPVD